VRFDRLKNLLTRTLRRQLVVGMVLVVATMMSLFVWDLTRRQQSAMLEQQSEHAIALARSVSTSAAVWVASRDYSGLQEIVNGLARYPDLQHAIVLNTKGQVLAHTDASRRGLYLADLPARPKLEILGQDPVMVDVAGPITLAGNHIGWVRIGLGQQSIADRLTAVARNGMVYALIAVVLAAVLATLAARRLTRRLYAIQSVADAVQAGRHELRADIRGVDEAAQLARQFNGMLDTLEKHSAALGRANTALRSEIGQRRDAEEERDRMISVMEASPDFISTSSPDGDVLYVNQGGRAMAGLGTRPVKGLRIADLHPQWATDVILGQGIPASLRDGSWAGETAVLNRNGHEIPVSQIILTHRDPQGKLLFHSTVMRDITERKLAEKQLERLNERLEERVEQRTVEMKAAVEEAERANTAKSEFLSRMSHELRTPLNAILGFGQLLETEPDHPLTEIQLDNVREILHAGDHLLELVNEVLDLSRIESGRLELRLEAVAVAPVVEACLAQIRPLAAQRGIGVELDMNAPGAVQADRTRLKEVLLNLLSNAVKYNREAGNIRVACTPSGEGRLRISVRDSGHGIAAEALPRLFKPFERLESAYEGIQGTGIGLALSKKLVEAMHGDIGVETVRGAGSTFWFELPLAAGGEAVDAPAAAPAPVAQVAVRTGHHRVLCIEDNAANLRLVQKIVATRKDIELLDAGTAEAGLEIVARQPPDLILLDINLPGMDGFDALRRLRENPDTRTIPVVALTANAMTREIERGMGAGFDAYLTKPIDVAEFFDMMDRCLPARTETNA
jgi:PAS domain S-box-containing protein